MSIRLGTLIAQRLQLVPLKSFPHVDDRYSRAHLKQSARSFFSIVRKGIEKLACRVEFSVAVTSLRGRGSRLAMVLGRCSAVVAVWLFSTFAVCAQPNFDPRQAVVSLRGVKPLPRDVSEYIPDTPAAKLAAQQLGKALFWDSQVGSDGNACASCHFHAGADIRTKNQVNPGLRAVPSDAVFDARSLAAGGASAGPNKQYTDADFPLHSLSTSFNRMATVLYDTNDVFSSQGTFAGDFISSSRAKPGPKEAVSERRHGHNRNQVGANEHCNLIYDPLTLDANGKATGNPFHADGLIHRKVEPRQTPTVINAVFNFRQFWDGRANNQFNGVDPFGARTFQPQISTINADGVAELVGNAHAATTGILLSVPAPPRTVARNYAEKISQYLNPAKTKFVLVQPLIENSSLASQAVGPPLSDFEMSCAGKSFSDLGRKLLALQPLATQAVHRDDSLFSLTPSLLAPGGAKGLNTTYKALIETAFAPKYWADPSKVVISAAIAGGADISVDDANGFTQMEHNFSLFWGLAIQEYESLLISDDSPFDRGTMSDAAKRGLTVFTTRGNCVSCHHGPLMSGATVTSADTERPKVIENMLMNDGFTSLYDNGYYNIGARMPSDDLGVGGKDPYGFDLSFARQYKWQRQQRHERAADAFDPKPCLFQIPFGTVCADPPAGATPQDAVRDSVDGAFKTPILRNVGLTPPYFHNGGQSNLRDVMHFYKRGGDRRDIPDFDRWDSTWYGPTPFGVYNASNLHPDIGDKFNADDPTTNAALDLSDAEMDDVVQFLLALTDERVACHAGIFDHPELALPMGHTTKARRGTQIAEDIIGVLPAVGKRGLGVGNCFPNSGDLFDQPDLQKVINKDDPRGLQTTFKQILRSPIRDHGHGGSGDHVDQPQSRKDNPRGPQTTSKPILESSTGDIGRANSSAANGQPVARTVVITADPPRLQPTFKPILRGSNVDHSLTNSENLVDQFDVQKDIGRDDWPGLQTIIEQSLSDLKGDDGNRRRIGN
jgi:cytochrome c peroxidase